MGPGRSPGHMRFLTGPCSGLDNKTVSFRVAALIAGRPLERHDGISARKRVKKRSTFDLEPTIAGHQKFPTRFGGHSATLPLTRFSYLNSFVSLSVNSNKRKLVRKFLRFASLGAH